MNPQANKLMKLRANEANNGFTLVELMVSVAIFSLVMAVGGTAVLNQNAAFKKTQHLREITDNLSFVMEDMARNLRLGSTYKCDSVGGAVDETVQDCNLSTYPNGRRQISFEYVFGVEGNSNDQHAYIINSSGVQKKAPPRYDSFTSMTPAEVEINSTLSGFTVEGSPEGDGKQPRVIIRLSGMINYKNTQTPFRIQTTVSQRLLNS